MKIIFTLVIFNNQYHEIKDLINSIIDLNNDPRMCFEIILSVHDNSIYYPNSNINQLLNVKQAYKLLKNYEGRALLYQRLILSKETNEILDLSFKLKESFLKDNIGNAFNKELKKILSSINEEEVPSNYSSFYLDNLNLQTLEKQNTKINNKIIHQSKLLKYFEENYQIDKIEDDLNTDINASVTRDNTTFNAVTLTDEGYSTGSSGVKIFSGSTTLTGSASPQVQLRWKIVGSNQANTNKIHGVALQWA